MREASKAELLLLSHLEDYQRFTYERWGFFYVRVDTVTYGLWDGYWIAAIDQGRPYVCLGAHPGWGNLPVADRLLAQKLMLETDLKTVWEMACQACNPFPAGMPAPLRSGKFPPKWPEPLGWPEAIPEAPVIDMFNAAWGLGPIREPVGDDGYMEYFHRRLIPPLVLQPQRIITANF